MAAYPRDLCQPARKPPCLKIQSISIADGPPRAQRGVSNETIFHRPRCGTVGRNCPLELFAFAECAGEAGPDDQDRRCCDARCDAVNAGGPECPEGNGREVPAAADCSRLTPR